MRNSKFCWCETGCRKWVNENNFDSSIVAEFDTYAEAKEFGKTRCPDDEDYGVFKYDNGKLYHYSDAFGQPLRRREIYPSHGDWNLVQ